MITGLTIIVSFTMAALTAGKEQRLKNCILLIGIIWKDKPKGVIVPYDKSGLRN